jgi:hypothetical protein
MGDRTGRSEWVRMARSRRAIRRRNKVRRNYAENASGCVVRSAYCEVTLDPLSRRLLGRILHRFSSAAPPILRGRKCSSEGSAERPLKSLMGSQPQPLSRTRMPRTAKASSRLRDGPENPLPRTGPPDRSKRLIETWEARGRPGGPGLPVHVRRAPFAVPWRRLRP